MNETSPERRIIAELLYNDHRVVARQRAVGSRIVRLAEATAVYERAVNDFGIPSDPNRSTIISFSSGLSGDVSMIKEAGDEVFAQRGMGSHEIDGLSATIARYDANIVSAAQDFAEHELDYMQRAIEEAELAGVRVDYNLGNE